MNVPLLDLKAQYLSIRPEIDAAFAEVCESQKFILGPQVKALEEAIAKYCGCAHAVGVSSGTDALLISLMAEGIGPGDEVITTAYSFFATAGCIARLGAKPVFVDIDPVTYNIDPTRIEERCTNRTKAILPVHLYGQMADMDPIMDVAERHDLIVVEDGAQAIGAEYKGKRAGSIGHYGCFSFFPSKNLGAFGDGGIVTTNDTERADRLRVLRAHGSKPKYYHRLVGGNFRLDTLQAAIVLAKLKHLDGWTAGRQTNAQRYYRLFRESGLVSSGLLQLPEIPFSSGTMDEERAKMNGNRHVVNQYVIRVSRRNELQAFLKERGIGTEVYYPLPLHLQECFAYIGQRTGDLPESEKAANETLAVPVYPELSDDQARYVVDSIVTFHRE
ncbi:MAG TPA: DegT/DnrJ/EryC1/StrS family aminotransferase [bacterium]|nr:DegT/DnrJ/EryC1/StrS family aminotransferase [bacterium]